MSRRKFLKDASLLALAIPLFNACKEEKPELEWDSFEKVGIPEDLVENEQFWKKIRDQFHLDPNIINLNCAGSSPQPLYVQNAFMDYNKLVCSETNLHLHKPFLKKDWQVKDRLAPFFNCTSEEVVIMRNTTEAINTIVWGLDWKEGDEVILSRNDFFSSVFQYRAMAKEKGVKLVWADTHLPEKDNKKIVQDYISKITPKTKLIHLVHVYNTNGQIFPVEEICKQARERGVQTIVDGAMATATVKVDVRSIGCDYYATSFHKWLGAPHGSGMLYIQKDRIGGVRPLYPDIEPEANHTDKFDCIGVVNGPIRWSIKDAIDFHDLMGIELKHKRFFYLNSIWMTELSKIERVKLLSVNDSKYTSSIALFDVEGFDNKEIVKALLDDYSIDVSTQSYPGEKGVRVSPGIFNLKSEVDKFVEAVKKIIQ